MVVNCYSGLDEFEFFKSVVEEIKSTKGNLLEAAYNELPEAKQKYMR